VPTLTVTESFPGSSAQFEAVTAGPGSVTVDMVNNGSGLQGFTVVSATNALVTIPSFPFGTTNPVTATFTRPDPSQPVDFTLRASSRPYAITIRAQCGASAAQELRSAFRSIVPDVSFWLPQETGSGPHSLVGMFRFSLARRERSRDETASN
jgi:hypothetical protein